MTYMDSVVERINRELDKLWYPCGNAGGFQPDAVVVAGKDVDALIETVRAVVARELTR